MRGGLRCWGFALILMGSIGIYSRPSQALTQAEMILQQNRDFECDELIDSVDISTRGGCTGAVKAASSPETATAKDKASKQISGQKDPSSQGTGNASPKTSVQDCTDALDTAASYCSQPETTLGGAATNTLAATVTGLLQTAGSAADACDNQEKVGNLMSLINGGWAGTCATMTARCQKACNVSQGSPLSSMQQEEMRSAHAQCSQYYQNALALGGMAAQFKGYADQADNCKKAVQLADELCASPESFLRPECRDFCTRNPESPICKPLDCSDPQQKDSNPQCLTFDTPTAPETSSGSDTYGSSTANSTDPGAGKYATGLEQIMDGQAFQGVEVPAGTGATKNNGVSGGGGGGGLGGGGRAAAVPGNGGGYPQASITTTGGSGKAVGGGGGGGGSRSYSGSNRSGGRGSANTGSGFNLKDFLPFGKLDPKRKLAALQSTSNKPGGVSSANGLSNWEKISRRMNLIRAQLQE